MWALVVAGALRGVARWLRGAGDRSVGFVVKLEG
jgi:hypothetical protein